MDVAPVGMGPTDKERMEEQDNVRPGEQGIEWTDDGHTQKEDNLLETPVYPERSYLAATYDTKWYVGKII